MMSIMEERIARLVGVKENILVAQARQKEAYDKKHYNPEVFKVGTHTRVDLYIKKVRLFRFKY